MGREGEEGGIAPWHHAAIRCEKLLVHLCVWGGCGCGGGGGDVCEV